MVKGIKKFQDPRAMTGQTQFIVNSYRTRETGRE